MNQCTPYQATELTDVLMNCCTNVLTVIQTSASGEESMMSADLTCLVDKFNALTDVTFDCETGLLNIILASNDECDEDIIFTIDLSCIDTYVTWVDNGNGSVTFLSADGTETIGVMRDCEGITYQPVTEKTDQIVMCKSDGTTVKGTLAEVISAGYSICNLDIFNAQITPDTQLEFGVCVDGVEYKITLDTLREEIKGNMIDGLGTRLTGDGSQINPHKVDLEVCELSTEVYTPTAVMTGCVGGVTRNMPAIKPGNNVQIQVDGTLNVHASPPGCDLPNVNYNQQGDVVTCSNGVEVTMPAINAGSNVTINNQGKLSVAIPPSGSQRTGVCILNNIDITGTGTRYPSAMSIYHQDDPYNFFGLSGSFVKFYAAGLVVWTYQVGIRANSGEWIKGRTDVRVAGLPNPGSKYPNAEWVSVYTGANIFAATFMVRVKAGSLIRVGGWSQRRTTLSVSESVFSFTEA